MDAVKERYAYLLNVYQHRGVFNEEFGLSLGQEDSKEEEMFEDDDDEEIMEISPEEGEKENVSPPIQEAVKEAATEEKKEEKKEAVEEDVTEMDLSEVTEEDM